MAAPLNMNAWVKRNWARLSLLLSMAVFLGLAAWCSAVIGTWHEETSVYPNAGYRILQEGEPPTLEPSCRDAGGPRLLTSRERPFVSLCFRGRGYPVMVSSYLAGSPYWPAEIARPLHRDDVFALRRIGLLFGLFGLWTTFTLVRRFSDDTVAAAAALFCAVCGPFVYAHALLAHYETLPWLALSGSILCLLQSGALGIDRTSRSPSTGWLVAAAALVGLSFSANLKAAFLIGPLAALAVWLRLRPVSVRPQQALLCLLAFAVPLWPFAVLFVVDPHGSFGDQVHSRLSILHRLGSGVFRKLLAEPSNLVMYWTDVGAYGDVVAGTKATPNWLTLFIGASSLLYSLVCMAKLLHARSRFAGDRVAAISGALIGPYVLVVTLLYDQQPEANYAPLYAIFGAATGATVVSAARWAAEPLRASRRHLTIAFVAIAAASFAYNVVRRGSPAESLPIAVNSSAQRALANHLHDHIDPDTTLLTATYNLAGTLESLGHGELSPVQAHRYLLTCEDRDHRGDRAIEMCMQQRWSVLLSEPGYARLRVVVPHSPDMTDERHAPLLIPTLKHAAASLGRTVTLERSFTTGRGTPVLDLLRVE